uniref:Uncharacterized protein n=1 Tax=Panagrolaimus sp. JU765 TaxID=591449 RepID=A0AC34Q0L6_9BILA
MSLESFLKPLNTMIVVGQKDSFRQFSDNEIFSLSFLEQKTTETILKLNPFKNVQIYEEFKPRLWMFVPQKLILEKVSSSMFSEFCNLVDMTHVEAFCVKAKNICLHSLYSFLQTGIHLQEVIMDITLNPESQREFRLDEFLENMSGIHNISVSIDVKIPEFAEASFAKWSRMPQQTKLRRFSIKFFETPDDFAELAINSD